MPDITVSFDPNHLPPGVPTSIVISANPAAITLRVKNDSVCFFVHPSTNDWEVVTHLSTLLSQGQGLDVTCTPFDTTQPAVSIKNETIGSTPLPHEDRLTQTQQGNDLFVKVGEPSVVDKTTRYVLSVIAPPFLTIRVRRQ